MALEVLLNEHNKKTNCKTFVMSLNAFYKVIVKKLSSMAIDNMLRELQKSAIDIKSLEFILYFIERGIGTFKRRIKSSIVLPRQKDNTFARVGLTKSAFNEAVDYLPSVPSQIDHEVTFIGLNFSDDSSLLNHIKWVAYMLDKCGFKFVDPYILGLINQKDKSLRIKKPNCTVWTRKDGGIFTSDFVLFFSKREVTSCIVPCYVSDAHCDRIWFAVVPR